MRRATLLRLFGVVLVVGIGAYSAYWWVAAGRIKLAAGDWARAAHDRQIDVSWQTIRVAGFPFALRLELGDAVLTDKATNPSATLRAPLLSASIRPWNFRTIRLGAPDGISALAGPGGPPLAMLDASAGDGAVALAGDGTATVWLTLDQPKLDAGGEISARTASAWVIVPPRPPATPGDAGLAVAALLDDLALPAAPSGFGKSIDELGLGVTMTGDIGSGPLRQAATAWRDSGGTIELDHFHLRWGELGVTGTGTLALDADLQPVGGFSGAVSGYDQLMNALVATGRLKASDARVARLALAMLGKVGPDGRAEISTSLTIQNGQMFLGPAKLGNAPRIDW
jgi:hypothetical protein